MAGLNRLQTQLTGTRRAFSSSPRALAGGKSKIKMTKSSSGTKTHRMGGMTLADAFDMDEDLQPYLGDDVPAVTHDQWEEARERLKGLRLIKYQMPGLQRFRQPFVPPPEDAIVRLRTIDQLFETFGKLPSQSPSRTISVRFPLSSVPSLTSSPAKLHKLKVLAGDRYVPPRRQEDDKSAGREGWVVIKCDRYPSRAQNERWASDTIDRLLAAAQDLSSETFADMPVPKPKHPRRPFHNRLDLPNHPFPSEWLHPQILAEQQTSIARSRTARLDLRAQRVQATEAAREKYGWDGLGIAKAGTFDAKETKRLRKQALEAREAVKERFKKARSGELDVGKGDAAATVGADEGAAPAPPAST